MVFLFACKGEEQEHNVVQSDNKVVQQKMSQAEIVQLTTDVERMKKSLQLPVVVGGGIRIDDMKIDLESATPALSFEYSMLHVTVDSMTGQTFQETAQVLKVEQLESFCSNSEMKIFKKHRLPINFFFKDKNGKELMHYTMDLSNDC